MRVETTQIVITNFVVAKTVVRDSLDNEKAEFFGLLDNGKVELLGLLSFKKAWSSSWPLTPSLQDRSNMKRLVQIFGPQSQFHIFHLIAEMSTEHRGSKTIGATYLLKDGQDSRQGPWVEKVPLHIPNICQDLGLQYKDSRKGGNSMLNSLIEEVRLDNDISSFKIMEKKLHRLNQMTAEKCRDLGNKIRTEEEDMRGLEWEVLELEQSLDTRMQQGKSVQRAKLLMYGRAVEAAIMLLEEKRSQRGSSVTRVMEDLSIRGE